jgi:hypothetical protein
LSDYGRYAAAMDHEDKLDEAVRTLCIPPLVDVVKDSNGDRDGDRDAPIDLTCDSDTEEDFASTKVATTEMEHGSKPELEQEDLEILYHTLSHDHANPQELLDMLTMDELNKLARDYNVKTTGKKVRVVCEVLCTASDSRPSVKK